MSSGTGATTAAQARTNLGLPHPKRYRIRTPQAGYKPGYRIPAIDKKLSALFDQSKPMDYQFRMVPSDIAIDILGSYNPIYSGRPKKVPLQLLNALAGFSPKRENFALWQSGLVYIIPPLIGVRAERVRISAAGLALLDHWAEKFPRFKSFLLAYDNKKAREEAMADCFDLTIGVRPARFEEIDKKNKEYQIKWEAREYRRMKKEEEEKKKRMHDEHMQYLQQMSDQQAMKQYFQQQTLGQQALTHQTTTSGTGLISRMTRGLL